jgi:hypothetical protein
MPITMSHYTWMEQTNKGFFSIRSSELKAIDNALIFHAKWPNERNLRNLRAALSAWIDKEGMNWRQSGRNRTGAVEELYRQVMDVSVRKTGEEMVAVSSLRDESRAIVTDLFRGKQLEWRPGILQKLKTTKFSLLKNAYSVTTDINGASGGALKSGLASIVPSSGSGGAADWFVKSMVPVELYSEIVALIASSIPTFMKELAVAVTPYVGVIAAGGGALLDACKAARDGYRAHEANKHRERSLAIDEPARAMWGVCHIIEGECMMNSQRAAIGGGEFVMKLAGVAADFGTATNAATGLAASLAKFAIFLCDLVGDVRQRRKANEMMLSPVGVDSSIFVECPIVGAYLVCCAPTSVLTNTIFDRFFVQGWQGDVERAVKQHHEPLKEQARRLIHEHRFWIPALQNFPGVMKVNQEKLKEMAKNAGKSKYEGFGSHNMPAALQA